jgi:hypothetical protein
MSIRSRSLLRHAAASLAATAALSFTLTAFGQAATAAPGAMPAPPDAGVVPPPAGRPAADAARPPAPPGGPRAKPRAPGAPPAADGPLEGRVTGYLLSPEADVAGVLLDDGREVRVPPHLGPELATLLKPGDRVRWSGDMAATRGPGNVPAPGTITALPSGRSLTDMPPAPGSAPVPPAPLPQGQSALQQMRTSGIVQRVLTGPRGEPDGVVLDNGTQVSIAPRAPGAARRLLAVGTRLNVDGYGRTSRYGTVVQATALAHPGEAPITLFAPNPAR